MVAPSHKRVVKTAASRLTLTVDAAELLYCKKGLYVVKFRCEQQCI